MKIIDLNQRFEIQPIQLQKICQQWQITELALFGSVLRDDFKPQSDIDLLVSFAEDAKITFFDLDTIEAQFSRLFNRQVDLVTKRSIEQSHNWIRKQNILNHAKIIYEQRSRNTSRSY
ncbi:nucleotidyltransferase family protein [Pleurocapsa sp. FMAR1]|uniref:nucleotidyltransferase family protein n=1 Tax=Pleurocapsa sp. FMAR1 TaxID=3040204 RepID=UPI0029C77D26|nr:nucleotidyltransferase family protein [Pleurocapsa sp. FMAR1]